MPIYEYTCSACGHRTDILHGINDPAPAFCPECGAEGTLRKGFAPPAILFKGSGWAKKDRAATRTSGASKSATDGGGAKSEGSTGDTKDGAGSDGSKAADSPPSSSPSGSAAD
ncbi:MAG TPA: FmdB family zinc ribbon protein [Candidatus Limnocylindrales bacterium]|nr:FmdB family zinc ribbon protein [Candidatus Limnocylindrales bacterium]